MVAVLSIHVLKSMLCSTSISYIKIPFIISRHGWREDSAGILTLAAPSTTKGWMNIDRLCMNRRQFAAVAGLALALPVFAGVAARNAWADDAKPAEESGATTEAPAEQAISTEPYVPAATAYPLTLALVDGDGTEF